MKKLNILLTAVALGIASFASAQLTANLGLGFHGGAFGNEAGIMNELSGNGELTETAHNYSAGGAIPITFGVGLGITDNISVDANFEYRIGSELEVANFNFPTLQGIDNVVVMAKSNQIRFMPSVVFHNGETGLYGRVGAVLPVGGKTTVTMTSELDGVEEVTETSGAFSIGGVGAIGFNLELSDGLVFFGEFQAISLMIKSGSSEIISYKDDDGNSLEDEYETVQERKTEYVDVVNHGDNDDDSLPMKEVASKTSYGSMGINLGIKLTIGG